MRCPIILPQKPFDGERDQMKMMAKSKYNGNTKTVTHSKKREKRKQQVSKAKKTKQKKKESLYQKVFMQAKRAICLQLAHKIGNSDE